MAVIMSKQMVIPTVLPKVGTTWLYEYGDDGVFEVPADGRYQIEMHGGGGAGRLSMATTTGHVSVASGGGSGELYEMNLTKGEKIPVAVGAGISNANGNPTTFGSLSVDGGGMYTSAGNAYYGGTASGSIASDGEYQRSSAESILTMKGGLGNVNKPNQTYGNGATVEKLESYTPGMNRFFAGKHGAVIITYLGEV